MGLCPLCLVASDRLLNCPASRAAGPGLATLPDHPPPPSPCWWGDWWHPAVMTTTSAGQRGHSSQLPSQRRLTPSQPTQGRPPARLRLQGKGSRSPARPGSFSEAGMGSPRKGNGAGKAASTTGRAFSWGALAEELAWAEPGSEPLLGHPAGSKADPGKTPWRLNLAVASELSLLPLGLPLSSFLLIILLCACASRWEDTKRFLETEGP